MARQLLPSHFRFVGHTAEAACYTLAAAEKTTSKQQDYCFKDTVLSIKLQLQMPDSRPFFEQDLRILLHLLSLLFLGESQFNPSEHKIKVKSII